jgi:N-acetylglucosamine-6-phosphate deacetylase
MNSVSTTTITGRDPQTGKCLSLGVVDGFIHRIEESSEETDLFLSPGLIDLQVNGFAALDVNSPELTPEVIVQLVDAMISRGVTCFAPTIITAPESAICRALSVMAEARRRSARVASCIPFVHVEGPHISPLDGYRGAHPSAAVRPPSIAEFQRWQAAAEGYVGIVTLSPHFRETNTYIAALVKQGVHVAIGHTHATAEQIASAVDAGASLSTHLGNGLASTIPRHCNPIWPQLADDRLTASFISDGHHLPPSVLKAMLRAKGLRSSFLVSDSVALAGMPPGTYDTPVGGRVEMRADGRLCVAGTELLAGATASLAECIGHLVRVIDIPLHEALRMATVNPGKFAGGRGELKAGARADIVRFRWQGAMLIEDVWLAGELAYVRAGSAAQHDGGAG